MDATEKVDPEEVATADEIAAIFNVKPTTVTHWAKQGRVRSSQVGKRRLFILWQVLEDLSRHPPGTPFKKKG